MNKELLKNVNQSLFNLGMRVSTPETLNASFVLLGVTAGSNLAKYRKYAKSDAFSEAINRFEKKYMDIFDKYKKKDTKEGQDELLEAVTDLQLVFYKQYPELKVPVMEGSPIQPDPVAARKDN